MTDDATPAKVRLTDGLGLLPEPATHGTFPGPHGYSAEQMRAERERAAAALRACAIAQQCIQAAYDEHWASFDALSDDFDDAMAALAEAGGPNYN